MIGTVCKLRRNELFRQGNAPEFVGHTMAFKHRVFSVGDGYIVWVAKLELVLVKDGNMVTVAGLTH